MGSRNDPSVHENQGLTCKYHQLAPEIWELAPDFWALAPDFWASVHESQELMTKLQASTLENWESMPRIRGLVLKNRAIACSGHASTGCFRCAVRARDPGGMRGT
jgi:hypothetical protein